MENMQDSVFRMFLEEAEEHLSELEAGLLVLEHDQDSHPDLPGRLFRSAHTLKGSAYLVKFNFVGSIAHEMETILEAIDSGHLNVTHEVIEVFLFSMDQIRELIRLRTYGKTIPSDVHEKAIHCLKNISSQVENMSLPVLENPPRNVDRQSEIPADSPARGVRGQKNEISGSVRVAVDKIETLMGLMGEFTVLKNRMTNQIQAMEKVRKEVGLSSRRLVDEVDSFTEHHDYTLSRPLQEKTIPERSGFKDLEFDRYDDLHLFSSKLREAANDVGNALRITGEYSARLNSDILQMGRIAELMKERISEARTVPVEILFQRFKRTIRGLTKELHKSVELCIVGGNTPIDRIVYDGLFDPLLHIVRNAMAHGIESREVRETNNKPPVATIWLTAERRSDVVEISVRDDGQGISLEKVRNRALDLQLIKEGQALSDGDLVQMIFRPGFSTTAEADATSGRGVGMSVVMDRLANLNGTIDVESIEGEGTTFRLQLPLSLVIVNVIKFEVGGQSFVIPSALVNEIVDLDSGVARSHVAGLSEDVEKIELSTVFGLPKSDISPRFGILTRSEGCSLLLLVDRLSGQEDTVIKPFGDFVQQTPYFSGTSLAGDGGMSLVVNPSRMKHRNAERVDTPSKRLSPLAETGNRTVLIVDDSLSVRKYTSLLLETHGFKVLTAADGMEALDILGYERVRSIITDLEMPVMHGYDFLAELHRRDGFEIPVAILSSRAGEQHQAKAISLGATDYLVKPFEDEALISVVQGHLSSSAGQVSQD